jgi:hypothetical protein
MSTPETILLPLVTFGRASVAHDLLLELLMRKLSATLSTVLALAAVTSASHAQTLPDPDIACDALPGPRLFIEAGDTQMTMLGELVRWLRDAEDPITLVYLPRSTCTLADNYFHDKPTTEVMRYVPSIAEDAAWSGTPRQCNNEAGGFQVDLGIGATFISSCASSVTSAQPADVEIFDGPVQAYGFVVPEGSLPAASGGITWEEAYYVFSGQGPTANAVPWTAEPNPVSGTPSVFIRGATTSTLLTCAANVAPALLPASSWLGYRLTGQADRSSVVLNGVGNQTPDLRDATIGILGIDVYEANRKTLDLLAFQAPGQKYGFYPDTDRSRTDKRNVRDGHYVPWSYTQYLTKVDGDGDPVNPLVERMLDIVRGDSEVRIKSAAGVAPAFDLDALEIPSKKGLVPACAMQVSRERDGGDFSLYAPAAPCGCFFESVVDPDLTQDESWQERCTACKADQDCAPGRCRHGYCEDH